MRRTSLNPVERERRIHLGERRRAGTRARLLAAAYTLFALHGADAPTIDDIIAEAGIARGTFYNHFKTRDELFRAVSEDIAASINARLDVILDRIEDPAERLATAFRIFARYAVADSTRGWILLRTMPLLGDVNPGMTKNVAREFAHAVDSGRIRCTSAAMAFDLGVGFLTRTIYRLLADQTPADHVEHAAAALLTAFGLDPSEAREIAFRNLASDRVAA
jgi:AcrR family transcriptional regulator